VLDSHGTPTHVVDAGVKALLVFGGSTLIERALSDARPYEVLLHLLSCEQDHTITLSTNSLPLLRANESNKTLIKKIICWLNFK
jgi:hypothetical protein